MLFDKCDSDANRAARAVSPRNGPDMAQICGRAADHVAQARGTLGHDSLDLDQAMQQLDAAIACLNEICSRKSPPGEGSANRILTFPAPGARRSG